MLLREEFEKSGNWLFRRRSYLPVLLIGLFLLALPEYSRLGRDEKPDRIWEMLCLGISFFGLGIRIYTIGHAPKGTSGRNTTKQVAESLNTTGAYSVVRNPLYLGNFVMGMGISLFTRLWWLALIYILVFWLYYERIIFAEEEFLRGRYGEEYLQWAAATPAFIPDLRQFRKPDMSFSPRTVLKREYSGFFAVIIVLSLFKFAGDAFAKNRIEVDPIWAFILVMGFIIWITLVSLRKFTTLLNVKGR